MPTTLTYSPIILQIPAAQFGIMNSTFRITSPHTDVPQPTANYSLLTANSSFTFSAKERDPETGYSYFGSRYYSSDLSIWLSVDPMSDKYPSLSPYTYCAENPVKLVDPDGEAWWIPRGKTEPVFDPDISMENCPSDGIFIGQTCAWQQSNLSQLTVTNCYGDVDGSVSYQPIEVVIKPHRCYNRALSENIYSKMKKQNTGMDLLSSCSPLLSLTMEAIKNKYPESKGLKIGSYAFGGGLAGVNIFYTWNSNKQLPEKIFDTSTDIIGIFGIYGTLISTELQTFKRAGKFFMQCKYELDMYFKEINNPNYWWN